MPPSLRLGLLAATFLAVALGVIWKERRAAACPRHRRAAGFAARTLAAACLAAGLALAAWAAIAGRWFEP
ncbi:hypothetical protein [Paludisphaera soli]|uniref:hypothetical protein n=1 Tax=Paludisphaera soli TaxID=2712865 RepID=UPI0013EC0A60|nr:hypothetical protein [Paludisphaera soli]